MGADGGITLKKVQDFKKEWPDIKSRWLGMQKEYAPKEFQYTFKKTYVELIEILPNTISELSGEEIVAMLRFACSCDCPYLYEDTLITAEGDNVPEYMDNLSCAINGISVETWT